MLRSLVGSEMCIRDRWEPADASQSPRDASPWASDASRWALRLHPRIGYTLQFEIEGGPTHGKAPEASFVRLADEPTELRMDVPKGARDEFLKAEGFLRRQACQSTEQK